MVTDPDDANDGRCEPADGRQESKGDDGLEFAALVIATDGDVVPLKGATASTTEQLQRS